MPATVVILIGAVLVDVVFGEPPAALHPVVWIGRFQNVLRRSAPVRPAPAFAWGVLMAVAGPLLSGAGAAWLLSMCKAAAGWLDIPVSIYLLTSSFAIRGLAAGAIGVRRPLEKGDLVAAREALWYLVSRDRTSLSAGLVAAAAIESVAENICDSIVAPLFFFAVGGVPAALAYRAINTLDAKIGYRGPLEWLGKAAARLDDVVNLVPARLSGALVILASVFGPGSPARALAIWRRDRGLAASPNGGHPMAAMAGGLGVELEKVGLYRLGAGFPLPSPRDIDRSVRIMVVAAAIATAAAAVAVAI
jgi:adenosylcobinamide-phosphate synthase